MFEYEKNDKIIRNGLIHMIDNELPLKIVFNKDRYEPEFLKLYETYTQAFAAFDEMYSNHSDPKAYTEEIAEIIVEREVEKIAAIKGKGRKDNQLMDDSAFAALFVVPAMGHYKCESTDALSDAFIAQWRQNFKDNQINKGVYEEILGGFQKKKWCYITTAVCQSMNKPDDCQELTALRHFRDEWMMMQEGGAELVEKYYMTAPALVERINTRIDAENVYEGIYEQYLMPCLHMIESGQNEACAALYQQMVQKLDA